MALSGEDWNRMDAKFSEVYGRLNNISERIEDRLNLHSTKINAVSVESVKSISDHEREHHDPAKKWTLIGAVVGVATGLGVFIQWLKEYFRSEK